MYDRQRVARGAGAAIAVWALIGLVFLSSGVAYAVPLAGFGGFNASIGVVEADSLALYPSVGDTSEQDAYPQTVIELSNTQLTDLEAYKDLDVSTVPGFSGTARFRLAGRGDIDSGDVLLKSSALTADDAQFDGFVIEDSGNESVDSSFEIFANDRARLESVNIKAHYLTASSVELSNLALGVCYDSNNDGTWERGPCDGEPSFVENNDAPFADANASPQTAEPGSQVTFDASSSTDVDGSIVSYEWAFGDGTTATGQSVSHAYDSTGTYSATLTVTDNEGAVSSDVVTIRVSSTSGELTADASANQTTANPGELVVFDGIGSSAPDGFVESYEWDFGDGTTATGDLVNHSYGSTGTYTATLTVTSDSGETATDTVEVSIEANGPPTTSISANRTSAKVDEAIALDGSGSSDADGSITSYEWAFDDGTTATGPDATHRYASAGEYTVTLTTQDNDGATSSDTVTVSVAENQPPSASATANRTSAKVDEAVAFDGSASSDSDGTITSYEWAFDDGTIATGPTATHRYSSTGTYNATLTVTDDNGATSTAEVTVSVAENVPPTASVSANRTAVDPDGAIAFDGSASSDSDGSITSYEWTFDDGTTATGSTATHRYSSTGTYNATLTVTDDNGATSTAEVTVEVTTNVAPTVSISANRTTAKEGDPIAFDGSGSSDSDGTTTSYEWDFGDGTTATGPTATHNFSGVGFHTVFLTVTDDDGASTTETVDIEIVDNYAPTAAVTANRTAVTTSEAIAFDATGSSDPDDASLSYQWDFGDGTTATGPTPTHSYGSTGTYTVTVTASDDGGKSDTATVEITVS
jgi:PKD repeat protein